MKTITSISEIREQLKLNLAVSGDTITAQEANMLTSNYLPKGRYSEPFILLSDMLELSSRKDVMISKNHTNAIIELADTFLTNKINRLLVSTYSEIYIEDKVVKQNRCTITSFNENYESIKDIAKDSKTLKYTLDYFNNLLSLHNDDELREELTATTFEHEDKVLPVRFADNFNFIYVKDLSCKDNVRLCKGESLTFTFEENLNELDFFISKNCENIILTENKTYIVTAVNSENQHSIIYSIREFDERELNNIGVYNYLE